MERVGVLALFLTLVLYFATMKQVDDVALHLAAEEGKTFPGHVLVTGGAGFIGSHATMRLLEDGYAVTIIDNYSRGNHGAIDVLKAAAPRGKLRVVDADLGVRDDVERAFSKHPVDVVIHFAAIAFVGESMAFPLQYYHNVTVNTVTLLETMQKFGVDKLVYSSTCATYGNPKTLPITEQTPTNPINPYGKSKLYAEVAIRDFAHANPGFNAAILRYFNVFGSDPEGRLGEYPRPELRSHGRISTACFDAAQGFIPELKVGKRLLKFLFESNLSRRSTRTLSCSVPLSSFALSSLVHSRPLRDDAGDLITCFRVSVAPPPRAERMRRGETKRRTHERRRRRRAHASLALRSWARSSPPATAPASATSSTSPTWWTRTSP